MSCDPVNPEEQFELPASLPPFVDLRIFRGNDMYIVTRIDDKYRPGSIISLAR